MNASRRWMLALAVATLPLGQAVAQPAQPVQPAKVTLALIGITASNWPGIIAQEKGYFRAEGLDVDWITVGQSSKAAQQVMAGVAQFGSSSMVDTFRAIDGGGDLVVITNSLAQGIHSLVAAKTVQSFGDLKGKRVIVGGQKDITGLWWNAAARHHGMDPARDVELLFSGSTSNRTTALISGAVQGAVLSPPASFQAIDQGFKDLGPVAGYMGEFPMMIYHVNKSWAAMNKDKVTSFVRAHNQGAQFIADPANKDEASRILAKASGSTVEDALRTYDIVMQVKGMVPDGSISATGLAKVRETLAADGDLKTPLKPIEAFYDPQYVEAAKRRP